MRDTKEIKMYMFLTWLIIFGINLYVLKDLFKAIIYTVLFGILLLYVYYFKVKPMELENNTFDILKTDKVKGQWDD